MKVGHFEIFFQRGSDLKIFLAIGSEKKNSSCVTFLLLKKIDFGKS